jgi:hypothetical protein
VFNPDRLPELKSLVRDATRGDSGLLDEVIRDVALLKHSVTTIQPHNTNSISLVASDGGNNSLEFNPFSLQVVVSPAGEDYALRQQREDRQVPATGRPRCARSSPISPPARP